MLKLLSQIIGTAQAREEIGHAVRRDGRRRCATRALLLALGLTEFSMHPSSLLEVRQEIAASEHTALRSRSTSLLRASTRAGIEKLLARMREDAPAGVDAASGV